MKSVLFATVACIVCGGSAMAGTILPIDDLSTSLFASRNNVGSNTSTTGSTGAIGDRTVTVDVTGNPIPGFLNAVSSINSLGVMVIEDTGVSATHTFTYGLGTPMNLDLSSFSLLNYSVASQDQPNVNITATFTSGVGTVNQITESLVTNLANVVSFGNAPASYASALSGLTQVDLTDIDQLSFSVSGQALDLVVNSIFFSSDVPLPASLPLLGVGLAGFAAFRRRTA